MSRKKRIDDLMEAITFAEAGEIDHARELASELFPEPSAAGARILAVSGAGGFPRRMVEDSLGMAQRLGYGIVALTVSPAMAKLLGRLRRGRRGDDRVAPDAYGARAAELGIPFVHAARAGDPERAVAQVARSYRRIAFLLVDPALAAKQRFARVDVPIFYVEA